ncbi:MAG TPA: cytochrome c biogenesis protein CcdA [Candidatus Margulisiibacteriota bacterium]|nr:cytochrome c biogenesis protein CcdA [Candidatus Margulisiibacteriota bacterium]
MPAMRLVAAVCTVLLLGGAAVARADGKVTLRLEIDRPEAVRGGQTGLEIFAEIERGWHINGHKPEDTFLVPTDVKLTLPPGISTDTLNYPRPDRKTFAFAPDKQLLVYEGKVGITTALNVPADFPGTRVRVEAVMRYQACNDSTCLPPTTTTAELLVPVAAEAAPAADDQAPRSGAAALDVGGWIRERGLVATLLLVMLLGLGLNLTPCVYPLISVTVAYFGTQGHHHRLHVAGFAVLYVLGITITFSIVGVVAALSGGIFGAALQRPAVVLFIAAVLVVLALSCFGLYQLQPPPWLMRGISRSTHGAVGALFMGLTMGIVAAPCIGPVALGLVLFVGSQQNTSLGLQLFSALGLGMGLPYLALALVAGSIKALPRSGEWLVWVERFFGVMLLGLAGYFVAPLLPETVGRLLVPVLVAIGGIYLGFIDPSGRGLRYFGSVKRVTGIAALLIAVWAALPQAAESTIRWQPFDLRSVEAAKQATRPALVDFMAEWCIPCHEMDRTTYTDPAVRSEAGRFEMFKADITHEGEEVSDLVDRYEVRGVPTVIFFDSSGAEVRRLVGYVGPDEMLSTMRTVR